MSSAEFLLILLIGFPLLILTVTFLANIPFYRHLKPAPSAHATPRISILIPARNEASIIAATVKHHLESAYPDFELILLDDNSDDGTGDIALAAANGDRRFCLISGEPLPGGWLGKNWACHQLAQAADGDVLVFTDADVKWAEGALGGVSAEMRQTRADLLSVFPTQKTTTWGERLTVPLLAHAILAYLPLVAANHLPIPAFAAANGQVMAFRCAAYKKIGGHSAVRNAIVEDIQLARTIKANRLRARIADGNRLIECRMYQNWAETLRGFGKNILAGHLNSVLFLLISTLFHWIVFVVPFLWLAWKLYAGGEWLIPFTIALATVSLRAASAAFTHQRITDALLMPLSVILMTRIAWQAIVWKFRGRTEWKGRVIG